MSSDQYHPTHDTTTGRAAKTTIIVAVVTFLGIVGVAAAVLLGGKDDEAASAPAREPAAAAEPAVESTPEEAPTPEAPNSSEIEPAPEVVIGQDDNGEDIVVTFEISKACATTHHQPLGDSLSYIRWIFDAPGLDDGTEVTVGTSDGGSLSAVVAGHQILVDQGISSYGSYPFAEVSWTEADGVENTITPDGDHLVDDAEGEASKTCLS